jgi:hypothetical protein
MIFKRESKNWVSKLSQTGGHGKFTVVHKPGTCALFNTSKSRLIRWKVRWLWLLTSRDVPRCLFVDTCGSVQTSFWCHRVEQFAVKLSLAYSWLLEMRCTFPATCWIMLAESLARHFFHSVIDYFQVGSFTARFSFSNTVLHLDVVVASRCGVN